MGWCTDLQPKTMFEKLTQAEKTAKLYLPDLHIFFYKENLCVTNPPSPDHVDDDDDDNGDDDDNCDDEIICSKRVGGGCGLTY